MSKVLYIKANPKNKESKTFKISDAFIEEYKNTNPNDEIKTLDLYEEGLKFIDLDDINILFSEKTKESKRNDLLKYAYEFKEADKIIFSAPMWNLSFPSILKAYIDYISVSGITFRYTSGGAEGLCTGKKAVYITSRGSIFSKGPIEVFEMGERYMRAILGFFGIYDVQTIFAEGVDMSNVDTNKVVEEAILEAKDIAKNF